MVLKCKLRASGRERVKHASSTRQMSLAIGSGCPGRGGHQSTALAEKKRFGSFAEGFEGFWVPPVFLGTRRAPRAPGGRVDWYCAFSVAFAAFPEEEKQQGLSLIHI